MFSIYCKGLAVSYNVSSELIYRGGMVAAFIDFREVGICKPNLVPAGFFMSDHDSYVSLGPSTAGIAMGWGVYETDVYEDNEYQVRDLLYCSENGLITNNIHYKGNPIIGIVDGFKGKGELISFVSTFSNLESVSNKFEKVEEPETPVNKRVSGKFNRYKALLEKI